MLCLEILGCVQHKVMYGVALWRDRSHYMDHRVVLITMWKCWLPGASHSQELGRHIGHSVTCDRCGNRPVPVSLAQLQQHIIHSEQNHTRNITLHHSSIKANRCIVLDIYIYIFNDTWNMKAKVNVKQ